MVSTPPAANDAPVIVSEKAAASEKLQEKSLESSQPGTDNESAYECPFCVMMRKGGCEEVFKVCKRDLQRTFNTYHPKLLHKFGCVHPPPLGCVHLPPAWQQCLTAPVCPSSFAQAFMECGEKSDKGGQEMAECLPQVRQYFVPAACDGSIIIQCV